MKKFYIVGNLGNMASRYSAVLRLLGHQYSGHDKEGHVDYTALSEADGIIITTPTKYHLLDLVTYLEFNKPLLVEKPLTTEMLNLRHFASLYPRSKLDLITMVDQYGYLAPEAGSGESVYDYFKSGSDGLKWDVLNITGHAESKPLISNSSPVWLCKINGKTLNLSDMDHAYIRMLEDWTTNPTGNFDYAFKAHEKVQEWFGD